MDRQRGKAVRAVMAATIQPGRPMPLVEAMALLRLSRTDICKHLARLREEGRIKGASTAAGWVRVW